MTPYKYILEPSDLDPEVIDAKARELCIENGQDPDFMMYSPEMLEKERLDCEKYGVEFNLSHYPASYPLWHHFRNNAIRVLDPKPPYCNFCNDSCWDSSNTAVEAIEVDYPWGYHSNHDNQLHNFFVCEKCYFNKLVPMMKTPPKITSYL